MIEDHEAEDPKAGRRKARHRKALARATAGIFCLTIAAAVYLHRIGLHGSGAATIFPGPKSSGQSIKSVPSQEVTLLIANDGDGSLTPETVKLALPAEPNARAKAVLEALFVAYAGQASAHPLPAAPAVRDVRLTALPRDPDIAAPVNGGGPISERRPEQLAVVDLSSAFADAHPSGIEPETLTLLSVIATLHANQPDIAQVRFLVDGHKRATLAGHADLTRSYLASTPGRNP